MLGQLQENEEVGTANYQLVMGYNTTVHGFINAGWYCFWTFSICLAILNTCNYRYWFIVMFMYQG